MAIIACCCTRTDGRNCRDNCFPQGDCTAVVTGPCSGTATLVYGSNIHGSGAEYLQGFIGSGPAEIFRVTLLCEEERIDSGVGPPQYNGHFVLSCGVVCSNGAVGGAREQKNGLQGWEAAGTIEIHSCQPYHATFTGGGFTIEIFE